MNTTETTTAKADGIPDRGVDRAPSQRPGVPMATRPRPIGGARELPPSRGTAQPLRGVSGMIRRVAYGTPEHAVRHWGLLLLADRVDAVEHGSWRGRVAMVAIGLGIAAIAGYQALRRS